MIAGSLLRQPRSALVRSYGLSYLKCEPGLRWHAPTYYFSKNFSDFCLYDKDKSILFT